MSGKKSKESRRVIRKVHKMARIAHLEVEAERNNLIPIVVRKYHDKINNLPFKKRLIICCRIIFKRMRS